LVNEPHEPLILLATSLTRTNWASLINHLASGVLEDTVFVYLVFQGLLFGLLAKRENFTVSG
jgi:hypothetical protein